MSILKYYKLIVNGYDKESGMLYAPAGWPYPISVAGKKVNNWQSLVVELRGGIYCPFMRCDCGADLVDERMKALIESYADLGSVEFFPVKAMSDVYGDRTYYILHFSKTFDVIDKRRTIFIKETGSVIHLWVDYTKVKNLHVFNSGTAVRDIILSNCVYKEIKRQKLDSGMEFIPVLCERHGL